MRLAHVSDPHLLDLHDVPWSTLLRGKRASGFANIALERRRSHSEHVAREVAKHIARSGVDHVVVTGDVTNLALKREFEKVARWLRDDLSMPSDRVTLVPGNHDRYTEEAVASRSFERILGEYMRGDEPGGTFPFVRLRGPLAIIGLDSAVPRPAFVAAGEVIRDQLERLRALFDDERIGSRTPVVLLHHPPIWLRSWAREAMDGLRNAAALQAALPHKPGLLLHGHRHRTMIHSFFAGRAKWMICGAPSASSTDRHAPKAAGYNTYEFDDAGVLLGVTSTTWSDGGPAVRALVQGPWAADILS